MSVAILVFLALIAITVLIDHVSITPEKLARQAVRSDETRRLDRQAARQRYLNR